MNPARTCTGRACGACARAALLAVAALCGCAAGPDYRRPALDVPAAWQVPLSWRQAVPQDAALKGAWWEAFGDPQLDALVVRALANNQDLAAAAARLDQARAQVSVAEAALYPHLGVVADPARARSSANRPLASYGSPNQATVQNDVVLEAQVSYEVDLFGRIRREIEAAKASRDQSAADFENARLVLIAQVATDYFTLRELDAESAVVQQSIDAQRRSLDIISARHDLGYATGLDLAQQQSLLEASQTQLDLLHNERAQNEHAIATLVAEPAPSFALAPGVVTPVIPALPLGLPSDLLERRPDVASAERAMAAANARIGVARAAYFPTLQLIPDVGWESNLISNLLSAPSRFWSLGATASGTLFNGGATAANVRFANADYAAALAAYRSTVLRAMEEVENGVIASSDLARAGEESAASVESAQRALDIANDRYAGGVDTFLDVFTAQQTVLTNRRQAVQIQGQRLLNAVYLVKALGGGLAGTLRDSIATGGDKAFD
jgi:NodT family efflux transporter outer membrane factor (OMF) lipoprotein